MQTAKFETNGNSSTPTNNFEDNKDQNINSVINSTRNLNTQDQNVESNPGNSDAGVQQTEAVVGQIIVAQQELELREI